MKIAQIAPLYESVPPRLYGGTERIVSYLTEELVRQGHSVTLFASGDSRTSAALVPCCARGLRLDPSVIDPLAHHLLMIELVRSRSEEFDILHFHTDYLHFSLFRDIADRTLTTLHGRLDLPDLQPVYRRFSHMPLVSISMHQRRPMPPVRWEGVVRHGLPLDLYRPTAGTGDYLAFIGRIAPEKRPDLAIETAKRAGVPLRIAAKVDKVDLGYFDERISPLLDHPLIEFVGEICDSDKAAFLGNARAMLFPIAWPEPFGLVMIEAMAVGTPVIAFPEGSVPEIVEDGITGFLAEDVDEAVDAIRHLGELDRAGVRRRFEERFSIERMVAEYLEIYHRLADGRAMPAIDQIGSGLDGFAPMRLS